MRRLLSPAGWLLPALAGTGLFSACDMGSVDNDAAVTNGEQSTPPSFGEGSQAPSDPDIDGQPIAGNDEPPPEVEREATFRAPVVTGPYVWAANPESGRVAVIDATSFEIRSGQAGNRPTYVTGLDLPTGARRALVINAGADDASLLELSGDGISASHVALHQGADTWSVSPDRRFAIAWTDRGKAEQLDPTDGFQDITVLELGEQAAPKATRLTVGYRPSEFTFDAQSQRAFGITEDGISIVELTPGAIRLSQLVSLPSARGVQPDVSITADGSRALARIEGSSILYDIDLQSGQTRELDLGGNITDLDLSADGTRAVAVIRSRTLAPPPDAGPPPAADAGPDAGAADDGAPSPVRVSEAVFFPVPAGLADASQRESLRIPNGGFGSVSLSPDGARAVLFSNANGSGQVTLVGPDLSYRSIDLIAPVRAVFVTADSSHAIALQDAPSGSLKKGAFSVLALEAVRAPKLVAADARAEFVALDPQNSERAIVTVSDPDTQTYGAYFVRMPSLQVDFSALSSRPLSSGTVPAAQKGFIAQEHPEGRITFFDLGAGQSREITGFELSAKVVNE
ncbi:MAG TPA: hypothetical protein VMG12_38305 [Polyangiaceae bacterium]|nr:hypothetical protein [Polyangiaceae bacterium]